MDWHTITQVLSLDNFLNWLNTLDPLVVHLINALVLLIEGIGVPGVPFEPPMLAAGILVHQGKTTLIESILWGGVANWIGNIIGYYLGGRGMRMLPERIRGSMGIPEVRGWLARYGAWVVIISRWFGAIRTPFILYAQAAGMPIRTYALYSFVGAMSWTAAWQVGMWYFGSVFIELWHKYQWYVIGGVLLILGAVYFIMTRRRKKPDGETGAEKVELKKVLDTVEGKEDSKRGREV